MAQRYSDIKNWEWPAVAKRVKFKESMKNDEIVISQERKKHLARAGSRNHGLIVSSSYLFEIRDINEKRWNRHFAKKRNTSPGQAFLKKMLRNRRWCHRPTSDLFFNLVELEKINAGPDFRRETEASTSGVRTWTASVSTWCNSSTALTFGACRSID